MPVSKRKTHSNECVFSLYNETIYKHGQHIAVSSLIRKNARDSPLRFFIKLKIFNYSTNSLFIFLTRVYFIKSSILFVSLEL